MARVKGAGKRNDKERAGERKGSDASEQNREQRRGGTCE
jgi:hypothetical protein